MEDNDLAPMQVRKDRRVLWARVKNGTMAFYVCGAATVLNAILYLFNFPVLMPVALHTSQFWLLEHHEAIGMPLWAGLAITAVLAAVYGGAGWYIRKKKSYMIFTILTAVYVLDILDTFIPASESFMGNILSNYDSALVLLFDAYGAVLMFSGFRALNKVKRIDAELAAKGEFIPDDDDPARDMTPAEKLVYEDEKKNAGRLFGKKKNAPVEKTVVSVNPSAAWPDPADKRKKARTEKPSNEASNEAENEAASASPDGEAEAPSTDTKE